MTPHDLNRCHERYEKAAAEVGELCKGKRWQMSVPVQDDDSDIVISNALCLIPTLMTEIERLRTELATKAGNT